MRQQSISVGLFSLGLGLLLHFWLIPNFVSVPGNMARAVLSPAFWPEILAVMAMLAGVFVLVGAFKQSSETQVSDASPSSDAPAGESSSASSSQALDQEVSPRSDLIRLLTFLAAMALYAKYLDYLGMVLASILMLLVSFYLLGEKRIGLVLSVSILLPLVLYAFFLHVAGVSIPQGELIRLP
ncbi:MAG: tripartite tricarboxylate transporter TctB family protein [Burkholderiaceae bacterium]